MSRVEAAGGESDERSLLGRVLGAEPGRATMWIVAGALMAESVLRCISLAAGPFPLHADAIVYWGLAGQVASGDLWLTAPPSAFRPPLYPWLLGLFRAVFEQWALQAVMVVQNLLGLATSVLAARLAVAASGTATAAGVAAVLMLATPGRLQFDQMLMAESLFGFLIVAHALAALWWLREGTPLAAAWAGTTWALSALCRSTSQFLWIVPLGLALLVPGRRLEARLRGAAFACCAALLVLLPWLARNRLVYGEIFLTRGLGVRLWAAVFSERGASLELATPEARARLQGLRWRHEWTVEDELERSGMREPERDAWMTREALTAIRSEWPTYLGSMARNFTGHWGSREEAIPWYFRAPPDRRQGYLGQEVWADARLAETARPILRFLFRYPRSYLYLTGLGALLGCGLLLVAGRSWPGGWWLLALNLYFPLVTGAVVYPLYRLRSPTEALLAAALAAGCAATWSRRFGERRRAEGDGIPRSWSEPDRSREGGTR